MMTATPDDRGAPPRGRPARLPPLVAVAAVAAAGAVVLRGHPSFEALARNREALIAFRDADHALAAAAFVAARAPIVAFSLPGATIATLTGGFPFATFPGALLDVAAATVGAVGIVLAAKWGLGDRLAVRLDTGRGATRRIEDGIDGNQWSMLFLIRLVPIVPFFVADLVPALVGVSLFRFAVSTFLGIVPGAVVYTSVGAGLSEVFARGGTPDLDILFAPHVLLPILGLAALAALPIAIEAVRGRAEV